MFLLDTNVVSELRKNKPHGGVLAWLKQVDEAQLFLSAMTMAEIQRGIELTREQDASKAAVLDEWLAELAAHFPVLAADTEVMRQWARLRHGRSDTLAGDALIAATAQVHRMTVVTRNTKDFTAFGIPLLNPFEFKAS
jgi:predicted nucleic acid-binding protein